MGQMYRKNRAAIERMNERSTAAFDIERARAAFRDADKLRRVEEIEIDAPLEVMQGLFEDEEDLSFHEEPISDLAITTLWAAFWKKVEQTFRDAENGADN